MGRRILGTCSGLLAGVVVIGAVETIGHRVYPLPPGTDLHDREALAALIASAPAGALLFVALAWFLGTAAGCALARGIEASGRPIAATIVGALLLMAGLANLAMLPHPAWFWFVGLTALIAGALAGWGVVGLVGARRAA